MKLNSLSLYMEVNNCANSPATSQPRLDRLPAFFISLGVSRFVLRLTFLPLCLRVCVCVCVCLLFPHPIEFYMG